MYCNLYVRKMSEFQIGGRPISQLKVVELRRELEARGLETKGRREELVVMLASYLETVDVPEQLGHRSLSGFNSKDENTSTKKSNVKKRSFPCYIEDEIENTSFGNKKKDSLFLDPEGDPPLRKTAINPVFKLKQGNNNESTTKMNVVEEVLKLNRRKVDVKGGQIRDVDIDSDEEVKQSKPPAGQLVRVRVSEGGNQEFRRSLWQDTTFTDVVLECGEDQQLACHSAVLAAASPVLAGRLLEARTRQTALDIQGPSLAVLRSLVELIYLGECTVREDELEDILEAGRQWQVKGLQVGSGSCNGRNAK